MIDSYRFGQMVVDGEEFCSDLIILPGRIVPDWWRQDGHLLQPIDLEAYREELPGLLVVGTGKFGMMRLDTSLHEFLARLRVTVIAERTGKAWHIFNDRSQKQELAGAFHLTC